MCLRVYGVTGRNDLIGGALSVLIVAQFCFGIYFTVTHGTKQCEFLNRLLFVRVWSHISH